MKKLAVMIGGIAYDTQQRILNGIRDRARAEGADIYVFTCTVNASNGEKGREGAQRIYALPDLSCFDGVILAYFTVLYEAPKMAKLVVERIQREGIPAVCIDAELPGMANITLDNYDGIYHLVDHLIVKHGKRKIYFLGGPMASEDCETRKQAYLDAMAKHDIPVGPDQVLHGNFSPTAGQKAWKYWTKECGARPEAVVCINDSTAEGVRMEAQKQGLRIPEDVILTGVDNNWEAINSAPRLTTIDRATYEAGYEACGLLLAGRSYEELVETKIRMPSRVIFSESCGCDEELKKDIVEVKDELVNHRMRDQKVVDYVKDLIQVSMSVDDFGEFLEMMKRYADLTGSQYFYLCLNGDEEFMKGNTDVDSIGMEDFSEWMTVPFAYENGAVNSYERYHRSEIVPAVCRNETESICYICMPLNYESQSFGYCVFGNSDFPLEQYLCYTSVLTISGAIQNIRRKMQLKRMVDKLNNMWIYDPLTELYNRAGFFHLCPSLLDEAREAGQEIFVLFLDLDGLKKINDNYGHEMGDRYICAMADIIKASLKESELAMRYGGDEYVILGRCPEYDRVTELMEKMWEAIDRENDREDRSFELSVSMGSHVLMPRGEDFRLEHVLEEADKEMYQQKRKKHEAERVQH